MFDRITRSSVTRKSKRQLLLTIAAVWQLVVYALSIGGIFATIYEWLGIPWNTTGIRNVIGTTVGLVLLELPLIVLVGYIFYRRRRKKHETTPA